MTLLQSQFWGKLSRSGDGRWHPLICHSADVAAVTHTLLDGRSILRMRLTTALGRGLGSAEEVRARTTLLAAVHDIGKAHHGFQGRRDPTSNVRGSWRGHLRPLIESRHTVRGVHAACAAIADKVGGPDAVLAAICHHGRPLGRKSTDAGGGLVADRYWRPEHGRDPLAEVDRIFRAGLRWSRSDEIPIPDWQWTPASLHLVAGLITLADWIGSAETIFKFAPEADEDPDAYWEAALRRAERACDLIGLRNRRLSVAGSANLLPGLFPKVFPHQAPTVVQRLLAESELPAPGDRLVIESDTGSGKTEAVLALYARLRAAGVVDGLYFALPTRATASAMLDRVRNFAGEMYAAGDVPQVELATGGRQGASTSDKLQAEDMQYPDKPESAALARWTSRSTKRAMAAEIVVGTVDQAMLAALAARHAHLRLAGLSRLMLVVDEVHAYDRYMVTILRELADFHTSIGSVIVFMSATLASFAREELGTAEDDPPRPGFKEAIAMPYPLISYRRLQDRQWGMLGDHTKFLTGKEDRRLRRIHWSMASEQDALARAAADAREGARVLLLRNTVKDSRRTVDALVAAGAAELIWRPPGAEHPFAYHSRYAAADRRAIDAAVRSAFGPGSQTRGCILVCTQVAEQSLDIDFDVLVSDLCPIDVLLQRLGRVHRHDRGDRGSFATARCLVIDPSVQLAEVAGRKSAKSTLGHGSVYKNLAVLELTRRQIDEHETITLPDDCRIFIELVYNSEKQEPLRAESALWAKHLDGALGGEFGDETNARAIAIRFDLHYTDSKNVQRFATLAHGGGETEAKIRTRLGDDRVRVELPCPTPSLYCEMGQPGDAFIDLPYYVLTSADIKPSQFSTLTAETVDDSDASSLTVRIGNVRAQYDHRGWSWGRTDDT